MDVETNHLVTGEKLKELAKDVEAQEGLQERIEEAQKQIREHFYKESYIPVPKELNHAVRVALRGRQEATISRTSGGKLSRWAASKRREKRRR